jgi:hypothetical protein
MPEIRDVLAAAADRVSMAEPATERLMRRRDRRRRNERLAAAVLGIGIGAIVIVAPFWLLSGDPSSQAASGPTSDSSPGPMGWVGFASTAALWLAVGVLGTAMVVASRNGVLARGRRSKEAQDMRSGTTREARPDAGEMSSILLDGDRQRRTNRWLLAAVVALAVALAGLAVITFTGRSKASEVDAAVVDAMDGVNEALNDGDARGAASWYAEGAELMTFDGYRYEGADEIESYFEAIVGIDVRAERVGDVIGSGQVGASLVSYESAVGPGRFIGIVLTGEDGKIQWADQVKVSTDPSRSAPSG